MCTCQTKQRQLKANLLAGEAKRISYEGRQTLIVPVVMARADVVMNDGIIRHYGFLAGGAREERLAQARELLQVELLQVAAHTAADPEHEAAADDATGSALAAPCPCCGGRMIVVETFEAGCQPRHAPTIRIDTS
jgi:hypothetical protein